MDKSNEVKDVHSKNISAIQITFDVIKLEIFIDFKEVHLLKKLSIATAFDVSKLRTLTSARFEQPSKK